MIVGKIFVKLNLLERSRLGIHVFDGFKALGVRVIYFFDDCFFFLLIFDSLWSCQMRDCFSDAVEKGVIPNLGVFLKVTVVFVVCDNVEAKLAFQNFLKNLLYSFPLSLFSQCLNFFQDQIQIIFIGFVLNHFKYSRFCLAWEVESARLSKRSHCCDGQHY